MPASRPGPGRGPGVNHLNPPEKKFHIPSPELAWTPAAPSSGLTEDLVKALQDQKSVALILPAGMSHALMEDRIYQMIRAAAPRTKIVAREKGILDNLLEELGELPYRVTLEPGGTDVLGRPYYLPKEHPLRTDWLENKKPLQGAHALLTIRPIRGDSQKLRELRRRRQGGCEEMEAALKDSLDQAPLYFKTVTDVARQTLAESFSRHLALALPFWKNELMAVEGEELPGSLRNRCVESYRVFLKGYEPCLAGPCPLGPQVFPFQRGIAGMVDTSQLIPKRCSRIGLRNYGREIVDLGIRATAETLPALNDGWPAEFLRHGGLEQIHQSLKQFCTSRHRRIHEEDLDAIRLEVHDFLAQLATQELEGVWQSRRGRERVPRVGPVQVLARVQVARTDPVAEALNISKKMRRMEHCQGDNKELLQAALIDVGTSEVHFMGIFFEEELLCDGFKPGFP